MNGFSSEDISISQRKVGRTRIFFRVTLSCLKNYCPITNSRALSATAHTLRVYKSIREIGMVTTKRIICVCDIFKLIRCVQLIFFSHSLVKYSTGVLNGLFLSFFQAETYVLPWEIHSFIHF